MVTSIMHDDAELMIVMRSLCFDNDGVSMMVTMMMLMTMARSVITGTYQCQLYPHPPAPQQERRGRVLLVRNRNWPPVETLLQKFEMV